MTQARHTHAFRARLTALAEPPIDLLDEMDGNAFRPSSTLLVDSWCRTSIKSSGP